MFGRKKEGRDMQRGKRDNNLSKYGLLDIPTIDDSRFDVNGDDDDDEDDDATLEAELFALTSDAIPVPNRKNTPAKSTVNLDAMIAESLRDIPSDDEVSEDGDNDPDLLNELCGLVNDSDDTTAIEPFDQNFPESGRKSSEHDMITVLQNRHKMYEEAEKNARHNGETMRARRFARGIKILKDLIKQASAGRVINEEDIPPEVVTSAKTQVPCLDDSCSAAAAASKRSTSPLTILSTYGVDKTRDEICTEPVSKYSDSVIRAAGGCGNDEESNLVMATDSPADTSTMDLLLSKCNEYKVAALRAKRNGNTDEALVYVKVVKQFEPVIRAAKAGLPIDLSTLPPPPQDYDKCCTLLLQNFIEGDSEQQKSEPDSSTWPEKDTVVTTVSLGEEQGGSPHVEEVLFIAPPAPTTVLGALEQRLEKYRSCEETAKNEGNSSKVRRMGRIVKQYESAIKLQKAGKPVPIDELPTPPGFGPIPLEDTVTLVPPPNIQSIEPKLQDVNISLPKDLNFVTPQRELHPISALSETIENRQNENSIKANVRKSPQSRQEKQLTLLIIRQRKFRDAAIEAKRKGEINQAKEYLRLAKGFDPLIEASQNGLPVDLASLPTSLENKIELESDFDIVTLDDCIPGSDSDIYEKLEEDLLRQTKMCLTTRDHFKATGDIASANRFEQLAVHSKKDLDAVKCCRRRSDPVPKFHYETRTFNIVQCCTELSDNDLELFIIQGINYNVQNPKDVDTYVKFEFPYPTDTPTRDRTSLVKDTNNPQYNQTFLLSIQRSVRACQRMFKRHSIKLEVWSRGGFFRGDTLIGTAAVKLMPLETRCSIHDAFDLMDGRKAVGGKVEVKVRIRNPILTKQVEKVQEKWLVIDKYL